MLAEGLNVTVNTDDPSISQITLSDEYHVAAEVFGLSRAALTGLILAAARASFLNEVEKTGLIRRLAQEIDAAVG
jgi:adenosine deaminase